MSSTVFQGLPFQAGCVLAAYTAYGYFQEKIMTTEYDGIAFRSTVVLVAANRLISILVALVVQAYRRKSYKPKHTPIAYIAVSGSNFLSTLCQYQALVYISFTTQTLAKCLKMIPVLVIGKLIYGKSYTGREYAAVGLVFLGSVVYVYSSMVKEGDKTSSLYGIALILGYLFFDGFTSTTQEKMFNTKNTSSGEKTSTEPVNVAVEKTDKAYDQMLWVNVSSLCVSLIVILTNPSQLKTFLQILNSQAAPSLLFDIIQLSLVSSLGLVFLLNIIASFGALTSSTIMTTRQFISIVLNSATFGTAGAIGIVGWIGASYVAAGVWLKVRTPKASKNATASGNSGDEGALRLPLLSKEAESENMGVLRSKASSKWTWAPWIVIPLLIGSFLGLLSTGTGSYTPFGEKVSMGEGTTFVYGNQTYSVKYLQQRWTAKTCKQPEEGKLGPEGVHTALASFPRSGNSMTRALLEHSTGYLTTTPYCDEVLGETFKGECNKENRFLMKTHRPMLGEDGFDPEQRHPWNDFDQAILLLRNPFDALYSFWSFKETHSHTGRVDKNGGLIEDLLDIKLSADLWRQTFYFWTHPGYPDKIWQHFSSEMRSKNQDSLKSSIDQTNRFQDWKSTIDSKILPIRYEDLRKSEMMIPDLARMVEFLLPDDLPRIEDIVCADKVGNWPYQSGKRETFYAMEKYTKDIQRMILEDTVSEWCMLGYETMFREIKGFSAVDCETEKVLI